MAPPEDSVSVLADLQQLREQLKNDPGNPSLYSRLFWSLHQHLKARLETKDYDEAAACVVEMAEHQIASDKAANATGWAVHKLLKTMREEPKAVRFDDHVVSSLVAAYTSVLPHAPNPDKLHSAMLWLTTQIQGEDGTPWYVSMVRAVGFERMQAEDFEGKEVNGYLLPSLAERVAMNAAKQIETSPNEEAINWIMPQLERLLQRKPQNVWLKYHRARLLIVSGRRMEARDAMRAVVQSKRTEFWAWAALGETYVPGEPAHALGCLCKAVTLRDDEVFLLTVREKLARVLVALENYSAAKGEVERILATRKNKNYRIPPGITEIMAEPWYSQTTPAQNADLYLAGARAADDLLFADKSPFVGVVTNIDEKSRSCFISFRLDGSARYRYHRTPWERHLPDLGSFVTIRVRDIEGEGGKRYEAVSMQPTESKPDQTFVKDFANDIKIIHKQGKDPIGFSGEVFIPGALLKITTITNGMRVTGIAVREMNRAKGDYGWRAVRVAIAPEQEAIRPEQQAPAS